MSDVIKAEDQLVNVWENEAAAGGDGCNPAIEEAEAVVSA